ncbi:MAG TPA: phosphoribosylanthranilate isomerase [Limnochordales bacterium]
MSRRPRIWVKVCGLMRPSDVEAAIRAGVDAIGVVMTPKSPRCVTPEQAAVLVEAARHAAAEAGRGRIVAVGVFSGEDDATILHRARRSGVDAVQLHGGESDATVARLSAEGFAVIRTLWPSAPDPGDAPLGDVPPWAILLDSRTPSQVGGTGRRLDPAVAASWAARLRKAGLRVILAGGLSPDHVAGIVHRIRPWGVDVSSGVEVPGRPGVKDPEAVRAFVRAVRAWEDETDARFA